MYCRAKCTKCSMKYVVVAMQPAIRYQAIIAVRYPHSSLLGKSASGFIAHSRMPDSNPARSYRLPRRKMKAKNYAHAVVTEKLSITESNLREAKNEQAFWEQMAAETEQAKLKLEKNILAQQQTASVQPKETLAKITAAANSAAEAVQLDEADTRKLIDQQLRQSGWEVDSETLTFKKGARPEKSRNRRK